MARSSLATQGKWPRSSVQKKTSPGHLALALPVFISVRAEGERRMPAYKSVPSAVQGAEMYNPLGLQLLAPTFSLEASENRTKTRIFGR